MAVPKPKPLTEEVLTIPEIAWLTNSKRGTVERWRIRQPSKRAEPFPPHDDYVGSNPVWRASRLLKWLEETQRAHRSLDEWREHKAEGGFRRQAESLI